MSQTFGCFTLGPYDAGVVVVVNRKLGGEVTILNIEVVKDV